MTPVLPTPEDLERFDTLIDCYRSEQMTEAQWQQHCADEPALLAWMSGERVWVHVDSHASPIGVIRRTDQ